MSIKTFKYATSVDLNMGHYAMHLSEKSKEMCTICVPWGLYQYNMLPMGIKVASDVFQAAMSGLFVDMEMVIVYMDDIVIFGSSTFEEHMKDIDEVLRRLRVQGMQINAEKSHWAKAEIDYLGFTINREGYKPQRKKIQGILDLKPPNNQSELRGFMWMVNFNKEMYPKRRKFFLQERRNPSL